MYVYLLYSSQPEDDQELLGIYTTLEKARAAAAEYREHVVTTLQRIYPKETHVWQDSTHPEYVGWGWHLSYYSCSIEVHETDKFEGWVDSAKLEM